MKYPSGFSTPNKRQKYVKRDKCFASCGRSRNGARGTILQEFSGLPGISEETITSVLLSDCLEEICKCGDAWNKRDTLISIPFSTDLTEQSQVTDKDFLLQQLMNRLGFFDDDKNISYKEMMRRKLKDLNLLYNQCNGNTIKRGMGGRRPIKDDLNYLDYSLLRYEWPEGVGGPDGPDLTKRESESESESEDNEFKRQRRKRKKARDEFKQLSEDMIDDIKQIQFRLKSFRRSRNKPAMKTLLYYQPYVRENDTIWKSFNAELGADGFRAKLNQLGFHPDFSAWSMAAFDCIIKGDPIPYNLYDIKLIKELRGDLAKLLVKKEEPQYDFFGFRIHKNRRKTKVED